MVGDVLRPDYKRIFFTVIAIKGPSAAELDIEDDRTMTRTRQKGASLS